MYILGTTDIIFLKPIPIFSIFSLIPIFQNFLTDIFADMLNKAFWLKYVWIAYSPYLHHHQRTLDHLALK